MNKIIIANFKSNKNLAECQQWLDVFKRENKSPQNKIILAPPISTLALFANQIAKCSLAVQDISPFPAGAYTGAVGTKNLEDLSVKYAIVGHSERRHYFHETDRDIALKVHEALAAGITPIVCVTRGTISSQANALDTEDRKKVIVAFEPIEHIGTGTPDSLENILAVKTLVKTEFGKVPYIYGGSIDTHSEVTLLHSPDVDGFLVGSACLDPHAFGLLCQAI